MPQPTYENQIKLGLLQNNLISMEQFSKTYVKAWNKHDFALVVSPNVILKDEITEEEYNELIDSNQLIYPNITVAPESELRWFYFDNDTRIFNFTIIDVKYILAISEMYVNN